MNKVKKPDSPEQKSGKPLGLSMQELCEWQYRHDRKRPRKRQEIANNEASNGY